MKKLIMIASGLLMLAGTAAHANDASKQNTMTGNYQVGGSASLGKTK